MRTDRIRPFRSYGREPEVRRVTPPPTRSICATCLVLAAFGCTAPPEGSYPNASPREVLQASYQNLSSRYIDPVDLKAISLAGLNRLHRIDSNLDFVHRRGTIALMANAVRAGSWPTPRSHDPQGWADMVADAMQAARIASPAVAIHSDAALSNKILRGVMSSFDRYTRYAGPGLARRQRASREGFGGLGISVDQDDGIISVRQVHENTPASRAGLRSGDRITHVDGKPVTGMARAKVIALLRGPIGSSVRLEIARAAGPRTLTIEIKRALIVAPTVTSRRQEGLLIIKVTGFNQGTAGSISETLSGAERDMGRRLGGIVLDLRGNPGGLLDQAVAVADLFLDDGPVISTVGRHPYSFQVFDATWGKAVAEVPLALLINGKSASASEIVAVALRDRGRAVVIGSASYGKGTVQTIIRLPNDGELAMTWARMKAPSGFAIQDHGIIPAICTSGQGVTKLLRALRRDDDARLAMIDRRLRARRSHRRNPDLARAACPPRVEQPEADMEIARFVLRDRKLYNHALVAGRPAVAGRDNASAAARP